MAIHQAEVAFYKKYAEEYDKRATSSTAKLYYEYWDNLLLKKISPGQKLKVLDLGCGTGDFLNKLQKKYKNAVGIDISTEMLAIAKQKYPYLRRKLLKGTAEDLPFANNSFTAVFIRGSLHHFQNPPKSLQEIFRILKSDGWLILLEPCSDFLLFRFLRKLIFTLKPKKFLTQHYSFTKSELIKMLTTNGFKIKSSKRLGLIAYPICARPDLFPLIPYRLIKKTFANLLVKLDEFMIKFIFRNRLSLLIIIYAKKE